MKLNEEWLDESGRYRCPECSKLFSKKGICSHIIVVHTEEGKNKHENNLEKARDKLSDIGAWNKGLKKENSEGLQKQSLTYKLNYRAGKYKKAWSHYKNVETCRKGGIASAKSQNKRSKNEILFCEMCELYFEDVKHNEPMFSGWDADVIIEDLKIAILWNGVWHYKKISKKQSLEQVQSRDKIKLNEIKNCGYRAYIIKDMGSYDPIFVKEEFDKFIGVVLDGFEE